MGSFAKSNRLVLVADGAKALLFADTGIPPQPKLTVVETVVEPHPPTTAQGTERPGRVHESAGVSRSAVEQPDLTMPPKPPSSPSWRRALARWWRAAR